MKGKKIFIIALAGLLTCGTPLAASAEQLSSYEYDFNTKKETYHQGVEVAPEVKQAVEVNKSTDGYILEVGSGTKVETNQKAGWFTKGKYRYYRMKNGKLCKKSFVKIGKYYYSFDSKGRMRTGTVKLSNGHKAFYNKRNGRYVYSAVDLKVTKKYKGSMTGKGEKNTLYTIPQNVKFEDKTGKKISYKSIKKGNRVRVMFKGNVLDSYPVQFDQIIKVKKL